MQNNIVKNLLAGLLFLLPLATLLAQNALTGNWKMDFPTEPGKTRTLQLSMKADGAYTIDFELDGTLEVEGAYTLDSSDQITLWDVKGTYACPADQKGVYQYKVEADTLTFSRVRESCEGRGTPDGKMVFTRIK